jgi:threonine/homoserine/homoserine lactone efflux protein
VFYLSVFPQFVVPERGPVFLQSVMLGCTQIVVSFSVNLMIVLFGAALAAWFARHRLWLAVQRYVMGFVLGALAVRLALEPRRAS